MPKTVQTAIAEKTAEGVIEGVELAAPVAAELATHKLLRSRAARLSGVITGGLFVACTYVVIARQRRLKGIEEKLHVVAEEVVDDDD
jgi:hypothetical protein